MKVGDPVRLYSDEWFQEGTITSLGPDEVLVDFLDWIQRYKPAEIRVSCIHYAEILVVIGEGELVTDYRN